MTEHSASIEAVADGLRSALESADLVTLGELLAPDVTWGPPGAKNPTCQNKNEVLTWYERGRSSGSRAKVCELVIEGDRVLVGLLVKGSHGSSAERWQVYTVRAGRITDIVGFDSRSEAISWERSSSD